MSVNDLNEPVDEDHSEFMDSLDADGVYLSGPIRFAEDNGVGWREELKEDYPEVTFNSPLDHYNPEEVDILCDPVDLDPDSDKEQILPPEYVIDDKIQINESDAVFVGLPEVISRGTCMEIMYAFMRDVPVYVWTIDGQKESGWVYEHAEFMSNNRNEVMKEVKECLD